MRIPLAYVPPIVLTCAIACGLWALAGLMRPVKPGTSAELYGGLCGVSLGGPSRGNLPRHVALVPEIGEYVYQVQGLHGSYLFGVPVSDIDTDFPRVISSLEERSSTADTDDFHVQGFLKWKSLPDAQKRGATGLFNSIQNAKTAHIAKEYAGWEGSEAVEEFCFQNRLRKATNYWANFAFEFLFLAGLVWFLAWPVIRAAPLWRWALHFGMAPLIWMMPVYLGYAGLSFTSAGPVGGVLYPWLLLFSRGGRFTKLDSHLIGRLPQVLEPLSQDLGSAMVLSGYGMSGPTMQVVNGIIVAAIVLVLGVARDRIARRRLAVGVRVARPAS